MKVVCVVDSINDINKKINTLQANFGNDIVFVVKSSLTPIFKTYPYQIHAVYSKNLSKIIHLTLSRLSLDDVIIYYTSLALSKNLLQTFTNSIGTKTKIVNLMPKYNAFENSFFGVYNLYVKSLFKCKDSLASPKLQFIPKIYVETLLSSHIGNKLFEISPENVKNVYITEKEVNTQAKIKASFGKSEIISLIIAMLITAAFVLTCAFAKINYVCIIVFIFAYLLDLVIYIILKCKFYFDSRFLN